MRVLVLGGTGAMGVHVCDSLASAGCNVVVTSRGERTTGNPRVSFARGDAKDPAFLSGLLSERWDAVVDFMVWSTPEFRERYRELLAATRQYLFLSSYRVYADRPVITEESPRLLDVVADSEYLATDEYALGKARCEDLLLGSGRLNWTIVRPAVTYDSSGRFQLGVHEAAAWIPRAVVGAPVPFPEGMLRKQATMSWGGDVARMIAGLVGNPGALGEAFTVSTSEHRTWGEVADVYRSVMPALSVASCGLEEFERAHRAVYQIRYDRMFDRVVDNSKVLSVTGIDPASIRLLSERLPAELRAYLGCSEVHLQSSGQQARFDRIVGGYPMLRSATKGGPVEAARYLMRRVLG